MSEYGLVMPFVTTKPDGPHDDESYVAGWEMGALDKSLEVAALLRATPPTVMLHTANRAQADLVAMKNGYTLTVTAVDGFPEYIEASFEVAYPDPDGDEE